MSIANVFTIFGVCSFLLTGCTKLLDVEREKDAFGTDAEALSSVWGIYTKISGTMNSLYGASSVYSGIYSDELIYTGTKPYAIPFAASVIDPADGTLFSSFWDSPYKFIFQANRCLEGLNSSRGVSLALRDQLLGEAYFLRALAYFYLIRYFGDVPLIDATDATKTRLEGRAPVARIEAFILQDLTRARQLLSDAYPSSKRVRANKWAAAALMARCLLYRGDWALAGKEATEVIGSGLYRLEVLDSVFLSGSREAIFQLFPTKKNRHSMEGSVMIPAEGARPDFTLSSSLLACFEPDDKRRSAWVRKSTVLGRSYYFPFKYKIKSAGYNDGEAMEYSTLIRLGEIYLIRAECQARLGNLSGAAEDLNLIKDRAGLPLIDPTAPGLTQAYILEQIERERQIELFSECGHRFFDLKRTGKASGILAAIKAGWEDHALLWPIPENQFLLNRNLTQNPGYRQ